jgi:hypothetical protein
MVVKKSHVLYYPDDLPRLLSRGSCYLKLKFATNLDSTQKTRSQNYAESIEKLSKSMSKTYQETIGSSTGKVADFFGAMVGGGKAAESIGSFIAATIGNKEFTGSMSQGNDLLQQQTRIYDVSDTYVAHVYLPLENLEVNRVSGVMMQNDGFAKSAIDIAVMNGIKNMNSYVQNVTQAQGQAFRQMMGHAMTNVQFETYTFEWTFAPKNAREAMVVEKILFFLNAACVSNLDLNNKELSNMFWLLPPRVEIGAISTDTTSKNTKNNDTTLTSEIDGTNLAEAESSAIITGKTGEMTDEVFWLRPKKEYYIEEITVTPANEGGSVLLNPRGRVAYTKVRIKVTKTALTTLADLLGNMTDAQKNQATPGGQSLAEIWANLPDETDQWNRITPLG